MMRIEIYVMLIMLVLLAGCSHPVSPTDPGYDNIARGDQSQSHYLLDIYAFTCNPSEGKVDVAWNRHTSMHLNALKFLEPPVNVYLSLESPPEFNGNILEVDIGLRNPFLALPQYTGFDVCGIVFSHGSLSGFDDPGLVMAGPDDTHLLNPDGFTRWWNPAEFPHTNTIFGYKDGLMGTPATAADFNATINGYKYFADGLGKDDPLTSLDPAKRGMFSAGKKNVRHYIFDLSGGLVFNYAVDVCWALPEGNPPYKIPDAFPPKANRIEPYNIIVSVLKNTLYYEDSSGYAGGRLNLLVEVRDHFNAQLNNIFGESPAGLPYSSGKLISGGDNYAIYELEFSGDGLTQNGQAGLLITAQSEASDYGGLLPGEPVCSYFVHTFEISEEPIGWARTWGSDFIPSGYPSYYSLVDEHGCDVVIGPAGGIYVTGSFGGTVDFDPGVWEQLHTSNGRFDAFLSKFSNNGKFQWALTWGGTGYDRGIAVTADISGNIFVTGDFVGSVDFDPGPGSHVAESHGVNYHDIFLIKFTADGQYMWSLTWGGTDAIRPYDFSINNIGDIYIGGEFKGTVDFDPGPEVDNHSCNGGSFDCFLMKLDANGGYLWTRTWGNNGRDGCVGLALDSGGNVYVCGNFEGECDFDPGPGTDEYTALGWQDAFLSRFDSSGAFQWVCTWGGPASYDQANAVVVSTFDNIYVTGRFVGDVDLDPGPGVEIYSSVNGSPDVFLTTFDTSGNFLSAQTWGGAGADVAFSAAIDNQVNVCVVGFFSDTVDFDPGAGVAEYTSNGGRDAFVDVFDPYGNFLWARAWGGNGGSQWADITMGAAFDSAGNLYATGMFDGTADFWPGPHVDNHISNGGADCFLVKFPPDGNW